jgi:hypothetical protein
VYSYFVDGRLFCVATDAVHGPQVTLWGRELTACVPADLEQFLLHADACGVLDVSYAGGRRRHGGPDPGRSVHRRLGRRDPGV